jgi:NTP pyrophosphatase (non-canonical NTP hydrolase)
MTDSIPDEAERLRLEGDAILAKLPPTPGETTSPGAPPFVPSPLKPKGLLTNKQYFVNEARRTFGQPLALVDCDSHPADIDAYQLWMVAQPLPVPKEVEDSPNPKVKRFGRLSNLTMGLAGEAGEVIELLKKHLRDDTPIDLPHLILELGDVAIVMNLIAAEFNVSMSDVLKASREKIKGRIERGTLRGKGDDR